MKKLTTLLAATALASMMASAAWSKTLIYCSEGSPEGFDPGMYTAGTTFDASSRTVYNRLVEFKHGSTEIEPGLAESWTISDDGLTYTLKMREAKFSDGSPITATDAAFSLLRIRDNKESLWGDTYKIIDTAEAQDDRTLVIKLKSGSAPFLSTLAMPGASIVSKAGMEALGEEGYAETPIASGAFVLKEWRRSDRVMPWATK